MGGDNPERIGVILARVLPPELASHGTDPNKDEFFASEVVFGKGDEVIMSQTYSLPNQFVAFKKAKELLVSGPPCTGNRRVISVWRRKKCLRQWTLPIGRQP